MDENNNQNIQQNNEDAHWEERIAELENNWKRALADYKNLEKRIAEERNEIRTYANSVLILRFLPVLDNLEMVLQHVKDAGLEFTLKEFRQILEDEGLKEINPADSGFDALTMEAVETVEGDDGKVIEVLRKGYLLNDRLIRPARVKVGQKGLAQPNI
jgi:molecular chaperone GrpE